LKMEACSGDCVWLVDNSAGVGGIGFGAMVKGLRALVLGVSCAVWRGG